jgi:hypothetical protein
MKLIASTKDSIALCSELFGDACVIAIYIFVAPFGIDPISKNAT